MALIQLNGSPRYKYPEIGGRNKDFRFKGFRYIGEDPRNDSKRVLVINTSPADLQLLTHWRHKNLAAPIAFFHEAQRREEIYYGVLECPDFPLGLLLQPNNSIGEAAMAFVVRETLQGLAHLHRNGSTNGNVRAETIGLYIDGNVKLVFTTPMASVMSDPRHSLYLNEFSTSFMAPEAGLFYFDEKCDVWSLGMTMIQMEQENLYLFAEDSVQSVLNTQNNPAPTFGSPQQFSTAANDFLNHCLQKDPLLRFTARRLLKHKFVSKRNRMTQEKFSRYIAARQV